MDVSVRTLAEHATGAPWAAFVLAIAARGQSFTAAPQPAVPLALSVLAGTSIDLQIEGDEGALSEGAWHLAAGTLDVDIPDELGAANCWSLGGDESYWQLLAHWGESPGDAVVSQAWMRDEFSATRLGSLDSFLASIVFAAADPEHTNIRFQQADYPDKILSCLREAAALRSSKRVADPTAELPVAPWERLVFEAATSSATDDDAPVWAKDNALFAADDALLTAAIEAGELASMSHEHQERVFWALDRRARYHVRHGLKPAKAILPPRPIVALLHAGVASSNERVAAAAWWAFASLETSGPKKSWLKRMVDKPEARGLDVDLIQWAHTKPEHKLTRLSKIRRPNLSSRLAAVVIRRTVKRLYGANDHERVAKHIPSGWSLSAAIGGSLSVHCTKVLEATAPHSPALAERIVELLEESVYYGNSARLLGQVHDVNPVDASVIARVKALAATNLEYATLVAHLTSVAESESLLLAALDQIDGTKSGSRWAFVLKKLYEREISADDKAELLVRAATAQAPQPRSVAHYLKQLPVDELSSEGRAAIERLAGHGRPEIAEAAHGLLRPSA